MTPAARRKQTVAEAELPLEEEFRQHLSFKVQGKKMTDLAEKYKKKFKETLQSTWDDVNENGSRFIWLKQTITVDGVKYKGLELRRNEGSTYFDEEVAEKIIKKKDLMRKATTPVLDQDKIRLLNQKGEISDVDLDKMFPTGDPTWAFWPVKGEVE